jgi:glycosyltransferase involved in cell wall biosynthesis
MGFEVKVLIISNYEPDRQQSMLRFSGLLREIMMAAGHEVRVVSPKPTLGRGAGPEQTIGKWLGYVDKFVLFKPDLIKAADWADVVHISDHGNALYAGWLKKPTILTCHDLTAIKSAMKEIPEHSTSRSGTLLQSIILRSLDKSTRIVCDSEATRRDLLRLTAMPEYKLAVVFPALNYPYSVMEKRVALERVATLDSRLRAPYLLHIGGDQWYKNRIGVARIFAGLASRQPDSVLVFAGKPLPDDIRSFISEQNLGNRVVHIPSPTEEDLRALYNAAYALLFPSLYEGFGWPILEAQVCGCPVITSDRPPMTEVGGDAALYVDPNDLSATVERIIEHWSMLPALSAAGFRNAARFDGRRMTTAYEREYEAALASFKV